MAKFKRKYLTLQDLPKHFSGNELEKALTVWGTNTMLVVTHNDGSKHFVSHAKPLYNNRFVYSYRRVQFKPAY